MAVVYKITNKINNNFYIGITKNFKKRMQQHKRAASKVTISMAIRSYGWENFFAEILYESIDYNEILQKERELILKLQPQYNETAGGEGLLGFSHSKKTKEKMSDSAKKVKRKPLSVEHKLNIGLSLRGKKYKKHSEEDRIKNSERQKGKKTKPHTEETKQKISKANKGKQTMLGKRHSEETKQKMRLSAKKRCIIKKDNKMEF